MAARLRTEREERQFKPLSHIITGITFKALLVIFTIHSCSHIQEHFHLAPFHTCHGNAGIDGAREREWVCDGGCQTAAESIKLAV